jgi:hypothetical protein
MLIQYEQFFFRAQQLRSEIGFNGDGSFLVSVSSGASRIFGTTVKVRPHAVYDNTGLSFREIGFISGIAD